MRWCVSIGGVLVAGALAGGEVATLAAPARRAPAAPTRRGSMSSWCWRSTSPIPWTWRSWRYSARAMRSPSPRRIPAGAQDRPDRQGGDHLFRVGGGIRPEDRGAVARDRRPGVGRIGGRGDPEGAAAPRLAHLDLGRDQLRHAAVRGQCLSRAAPRHRHLRRRRQPQRRAGDGRARRGAGARHHHQRPADHGEGNQLRHHGYREPRYLLRGLRDRRRRLVRGADQDQGQVQGGDSHQARDGGGASRRRAARRAGRRP